MSSLELFSKVQPYHSLVKLNIDLYRLVIFYNLKHFESVTSLSDSFVRFVKYHKEINTDQKRFYIDFIDHFKKLLKLNLDDNRYQEPGLFKIETQSKINLPLKTWFLEKLDEMDLTK